MFPKPSSFHSALTEERLSVIAEALLDIRFSTIQEMQSDYDSNFSREVAAFERSKNMLISLCMSKSYRWLSLLNPGMDVTFCIGAVPCRFFRDDPESPDKKGFFRRNAVDDMFSDDDSHPVIWRFVIERAEGDASEDLVHFIGYNIYQEKVSQWTHGSKGVSLHSVGGSVPAPRTLPPAPVEILDDDTAGTGDYNAVNE